MQALSSTTVSSRLHLANISHPRHFQPAFLHSLVCFIKVCICLFSAAVPWTGGVGDAAAPGESSRPPSASQHGGNHGSQRNHRQRGNSPDGWQNLPPGHPLWVFFFLLRRYAHTRTHAESPRCRGLPASLEPQAPFYRKKPQLLVGGACCLLVQYQGSCWIKPTVIHEATVNAVIVPKWEIGLALFLLPSFNSECRLLKAIWAGPGNIALL